MSTHDPDPALPWHAPERAWVPMIWLIRLVAVSLALVLFAPLIQGAVSLA